MHEWTFKFYDNQLETSVQLVMKTDRNDVSMFDFSVGVHHPLHEAMNGAKINNLSAHVI